MLETLPPSSPVSPISYRRGSASPSCLSYGSSSASSSASTSSSSPPPSSSALHPLELQDAIHQLELSFLHTLSSNTDPSLSKFASETEALQDRRIENSLGSLIQPINLAPLLRIHLVSSSLSTLSTRLDNLDFNSPSVSLPRKQISNSSNTVLRYVYNLYFLLMVSKKRKKRKRKTPLR